MSASTYVSPSISATLSAQVTPGNTTIPQFQLKDSTIVAPSVGLTGFTNASPINGSIVSGTPLSINLLTLLDPVGQAISTVGHVVSIKITNLGTVGTLSHGGGSNPLYSADPKPIGPGDFYCQSFNGNPLAVVSSSTQYLQVTASTGTIPYSITIYTTAS